MAAAPVRERPIIFSATMIPVILSGEKTQTRRQVRHQPAHGVRESPFYPSGLEDLHGREIRPCPYGQPGDQLWVREAFSQFPPLPVGGLQAPEGFGYRADLDQCGQVPVGGVYRSTHNCRWKPSIHMPRAASRIQLEITELHLQQLQAISKTDAEAEGCTGPDPLGEFMLLWEILHGPGSWAANPWVWVLSFKKVNILPGSIHGHERDQHPESARGIH